MSSDFQHYPAKPKNNGAYQAYLILTYAHESASSLLTIFNSRAKKGSPAAVDQDLLRAMLLFASSGLDSMIKQLIRDALPIVIDNDQGAKKLFVQNIEKMITRQEKYDLKFVIDAIVDSSPKDHLISLYVKDLTSSSMQSKDEILRAAAFFNIRSQDITADPNGLRDIFVVRNQIAHEMDIDFDQQSRNRRPRRRENMFKATEEIFHVASKFLQEVDKKLSQ